MKRIFAGMIILAGLSGGYGKSQCYSDLPMEDLSEKEKKSLQWMREEEMLAHDVYAFLADQYEIPVFRNISKSEMRHTTALAELLNRYGLEDPAMDHEPGIFSEPELQLLYDQLVIQGESSYEEAIKVGLKIEDLDIADLEKALAEEVDNQDILFVYNNLLRGSINHLNAFWFHASRNSIPYDPQHISNDKFNELVRSENTEY
ncbi:MAG: DUF2202 domain-containing protein [Bacteroidales bacterium]|nr:DUF2202 domain-containing protein [Bacteroidales bacterium]